MKYKNVCIRCLVTNKQVKLAYANHLIFLLSRCIIKKRFWTTDRFCQSVKRRY